MTIIEFLEARITEDEVVARAASPGPWHTNAEATEVFALDDITVAEGFALSGAQLRATTKHIARHDPARVLAECAAKRAIIKQADEASSDRSGVINEYCVGDKERAEAYATDPGKLILESLAAVHSDHPDYQREWAL